MGMMNKDQISNYVLPILVKSSKDPIPNVRFCIGKIFKKLIPILDHPTVSSKVKP